MKEIFKPFMKKKWLLRMFFVGILFVVVAAPFKSILALIPGMTEVRPANMIPVVFGIMWGPAGAWGISIANAITDIMSGSGFDVWIPGFFINFFYAYLPYKMWYSIDLKRGYVNEPRLRSVRDILWFIFIVFVDSLVTTTLLSILFEYLGFQSYGSSWLLLFFNNFDFAVVLGIPTLLIWSSRRNAVFWEPEGSKKNGKAFPIICDVLIFNVAFFGLVYYLLSQFAGTEIPGSTEQVLLAICLSIQILYIIKPFSSYRSMVFKVDIRTMSIRAKMVLGFLLVTIFCVILVGITAYYGRTDALERKELWEYIYTVVGIALNVMFVVSILFLTFVERNISIPLEVLAEEVDEFARRDHLEDVKSGVDLNLKRVKIYTGDEIEGLAESFGYMMNDITNYVDNLVSVTAEKERIGAELTLATKIQADMLPNIYPAFPERDEFDIYAVMDPAKEVGGDFYDYFLIDDDHLGLVIADVSGKGIPASLFMMMSKIIISDFAQMGLSPAEILEKTNDRICDGNDEDMFVTVWFGILEISTGHVVAGNAGHEYPIIKGKNGEFTVFKDNHDFVIGGMEGMPYSQYEFDIEKGGTLFLYTDGCPEATDAHDELFGIERMLEALNKEPDAEPKKLLDNMKGAVDEFVGEAPQFDDLTMMAVKLF